MPPRWAMRAARVADAEAIAAVINLFIRETLVTFTSEEKTAVDLVDAITDADGAFHVVEAEGRILGYATYGPFRSGPGYAETMEHSIALVPEARGSGAGRALMEAIQDHARVAGVHTFIAGVSGENPQGVAFHKTMGFEQVGRLPDVGRKFGRRIDLVLMQKFL